MDSNEPDQRLNQIATLWTLVRRAHADAGEDGLAARHALLERYNGAIRRYLLGALHDADAADELAQDFAARFLHGDLRHADPERGRFRDFVKGVLFHLLADYHNRRARQPAPLSSNFEPGESCSLSAEREREFLTAWRDELLSRTWSALEAHEKAHGQPYYTVLRFRADHPDLSSSQMAERLSVVLGKALTAAGVRKTLERARDCFADLLLEEIAQGLEGGSLDRLEEELIDLGLLEHCRSALERRRQEGGNAAPGTR
jgi:RNA polymerase sigma-70 factor (ECF subfamily)